MAISNYFNQLTLPKALKHGDTLGIISPAAPSSAESIETGKTYLESLGFRVKLLPNVLAENYYVAGTVEQRLSDFHQAFLDDEINGILCARGGYGAMHLLPHIDWQIVKNNAKVFIGFSDITVLLLEMAKKANLLGFHGPMLTSNLIENNVHTQAQLWDMVMAKNSTPPFVIAKPEAEQYFCLNTGQARGPLVGGNLSLLTALCGTPYQPNLNGCVVFIEDWKESYYSIDRQWQQLKWSGMFDGITGLVLGDFVEITDNNKWPSYPLPEYFKALMADLKVPVGLGLSFGHGARTATLPFGAPCHFEASSGRLEILHAPVC